jgi:hypothetical protein
LEHRASTAVLPLSKCSHLMNLWINVACHVHVSMNS